MVLFVMSLLDQRNVHVLFLQRVNATLVPFKSILDRTCNEASLTFSHTTVYTHTHTHTWLRFSKSAVEYLDRQMTLGSCDWLMHKICFTCPSIDPRHWDDVFRGANMRHNTPVHIHTHINKKRWRRKPEESYFCFAALKATCLSE